MRINIENDEHIIASLPKIWKNELGFAGFFNKSREGILALTNKKIIFVPKFVLITSKEREKYFGGDKARITQLARYSDVQLDEDISENPKSLLVPLKFVISVETVKLRNVNFLRMRFLTNGKTKGCDFGITKSVTNYPIRQPLLFYSIEWNDWITLIKSNF